MVTAALRPRNRRFDNVFFLAMAFVILVSVVIGFSQTYFAAPLPNLIVKIHAAVFALWILLLVVLSGCHFRLPCSNRKSRWELSRDHVPPGVDAGVLRYHPFRHVHVLSLDLFCISEAF